MKTRSGGRRQHTKILSNDQTSSTATFVSIISDCWNNPSESIPSPSHFKRKTTCLFCRKSVVLPITSGEHVGKLQKSIRCLYKHIKIPSSELPQKFTREMFPFCASCDSLMEEVKKQDLAMRNALEKLEEAVSGIEKVVADTESIQTGRNQKGPTTTKIEKKKYTKMPELLLQGYRQKLFRKQHIDDDTNVSTEDVHRFNDQMDTTDYDNEDIVQLLQNNQIDEHTTDEEHEYILADLELNDANQLENVNISVVDHNDKQREEEYEQKYENSLNCTLKITNTKSLRNVASVGTSLTQIKQEAHIQQHNEDMEQELNDDTAHLQREDNGFFIQGIEIHWKHGAKKLPQLNYLQCRHCSYIAPIRRLTKKNTEYSPYKRLKKHILHTHIAR